MAREKTERVFTDAEWKDFRKTLYERKRMKPAKLRQHETARRNAGEPPPTLLEAIEVLLRAQPRIRRDTLLRPFNAPSVATSGNLAALAALFEADPWLQEYGEAAALTPEERLAKWGWLIGLPFDATVPPHMQHEGFRWEIPRWALAAKYDCGARDDYFCEIVDGRMDKQHLDKIVTDRKYIAKASTKAKRALHPDELTLDVTQRSHLRKLRGRLSLAERILTANTQTKASRAAVERSESYVASARAAIAAARRTYGLPERQAP